MRELRAAVVGCGVRAPAHATACDGTPGVTVAACCDLDAGRARALAERFGIPGRYTDVARMREEIRPDLVHVVTPPAGRLEVVRAVLRGEPRAVIVEKPLALTPHEAESIIDECAAAGAELVLNHQLRHLSTAVELRDFLAGAPIGRIRAVRAGTRCDLHEQGSHLFDLVQAVLGDGFTFHRVLAQATGLVETGPTKGTPATVCGIIECSAGVQLAFACGLGAPGWTGTDNAWHQLGVEVVADGGIAGLSLNRGWWYRTDSGSGGALADLEAREPRAQRELVQSVVRRIREPGGAAGAPSSPREMVDLFAAVETSAYRRRWTAPGGGRSADCERLRRCLAESERAAS
ncbi:Gfo/Idh/MocA family oxidoreductase [Saccharothrix sp. AJ9571]|nr:Gfo/Idh/MocA family oxidoreductase [Saccharothrix sp. AJ9571]